MEKTIKINLWILIVFIIATGLLYVGTGGDISSAGSCGPYATFVDSTGQVGSFLSPILKDSSETLISEYFRIHSAGVFCKPSSVAYVLPFFYFFLEASVALTFLLIIQYFYNKKIISLQLYRLSFILFIIFILYLIIPMIFYLLSIIFQILVKADF